MGWAAARIREYQRGQPASWLERRMLEHANPVHFPLSLVASAGLMLGLWLHDPLLILGAAGLAFLGHLYCWIHVGGTQARDSGQVALPPSP